VIEVDEHLGIVASEPRLVTSLDKHAGAVQAVAALVLLLVTTAHEALCSS
jgi:hypothetical protein